ncbi:MAG TPA: MXAN_5187 C-terminal domain-containing protein [Terriglobia bacterium]|nr:MXAN_5187 C-terminal domain-containing protein [Terriglobia bacterium]
MTVDEEFNKLDDDLRRLKVEYEVYFNGGSPRPPHDTLYRVETAIKRFSSDQSMLNFSQRFRFTSLQQKYAVNKNLWQRKLQEKEEGRSLTGQQKRQIETPIGDGTFRVVFSDPEAETEKVRQLLQAMQEARKRTGETMASLDASAFHKFIKAKANQVRTSLGCDKVQFSISVEDGKVKFKATKGA